MNTFHLKPSIERSPKLTIQGAFKIKLVQIQHLCLAPFKFRSRVKQQLIFTRQLTTMISAGMPLISGLRILARNGERSRINLIIGDVTSALEEGHSLYEALGKHQKFFGDFYLSLIRISEFTGKMELILNQLLKHLENSLRLQNHLVTALIYPIVVILTTILVCMVLLISVVPTFRDLFSELGAELPFSTRCVIFVGDLCQTYYLYMMGLTGSFLIGCLIYLSTSGGKELLNRCLLKVPILGRLIIQVIAARFLRNLGIILSSGGSIIEGIQVCVSNLNVVRADDIIENCTKDLGDGKSLCEALKHLPFLSPLSLQMLAVGESSGATERILENIAEMYERDVENLVASLKQLIEPAMILFLAVFVGSIVFAMYAPIFSMGGLLSQ